ncbi:fatty acid desaturase [Vibrio profundum]|uniref:fatty acid desaturase n=1 Tax=Vibrio profundum TaxID=2910247 RepID=UPI003D1240A6
MWSSIWLLGGFLSSIYITNNNLNLILLLPSVIFSASGARYIVATMIHQAVHNTLFENKTLNRVYSEVFSTILLVQPYDSYKRFHIVEHHSDDFSTMNDKDLAALYKLGFKPGSSVKQMKKNLFHLCISPIFHINYFYGRIRSNLIGVPLYRLAMTITWLTVITFLMYNSGAKLNYYITRYPIYICIPVKFITSSNH